LEPFYKKCLFQLFRRKIKSLKKFQLQEQNNFRELVTNVQVENKKFNYDITRNNNGLHYGTPK
jgi:hypothetical protein